MADETTATKRIRRLRTSRQKAAGAEASKRHRAKLKVRRVPSAAQIDRALAACLLRAVAAECAKRGNTDGIDKLLAKAIEGAGWPADGPAAEAVIERASWLAAAR